MSPIRGPHTRAQELGSLSALPMVPSASTATKVRPGGSSWNHLLRASASLISCSQEKVSPAATMRCMNCQIAGQSSGSAARTPQPPGSSWPLKVTPSRPRSRMAHRTRATPHTSSRCLRLVTDTALLEAASHFNGWLGAHRGCILEAWLRGVSRRAAEPEFAERVLERFTLRASTVRSRLCGTTAHQGSAGPR
jgi:hypothetical protein